MITPWYDLMSGMCREIGETLIHWSHNVFGHPVVFTEDEWRAMLYMHGCTLLRYGDSERIIDNETEEQLADRLQRKIFTNEYNVTEQEAKASMRWVVDNFDHMWD